ncbi:Hypothetical predicted protein [Prunus dulcis]|uniref:Uncharacterized protein n=1 Tax=Prunus dulcis TaxID=3755 RepID=A0A5E4GLG6_PRUDU|nr:Hypothetical predicted protein [Prunus dulcis]
MRAHTDMVTAIAMTETLVLNALSNLSALFPPTVVTKLAAMAASAPILCGHGYSPRLSCRSSLLRPAFLGCALSNRCRLLGFVIVEVGSSSARLRAPLFVTCNRDPQQHDLFMWDILRFIHASKFWIEGRWWWSRMRWTCRTGTARRTRLFAATSSHWLRDEDWMRRMGLGVVATKCPAAMEELCREVVFGSEPMVVLVISQATP